jgi:hypothetical protein
VAGHETTDVEALLAELPDLDDAQLMSIIAAWENADPELRSRALRVLREKETSARLGQAQRSVDAVSHWANTPELPIGSAPDVLRSDLRRRAAPALSNAAAAMALGDALDPATRDVLLSPWRSRRR